MSRNQRRQILLNTLLDLTFTADSEEVQLATTMMWLIRVKGKPVVISVRASVADPDHELRLAAARAQEKVKKEQMQAHATTRKSL